MKSHLLVIAAAAAVLTSCSGSNTEAIAAAERVEHARELINQGRPECALSELDSVDSLYPSQIAARRLAAALRPKAIARLTESKIVTADSLIAATQAELAGMDALFRHVSGGELEGYYVPATEPKGAFTSTTGVQPRVNDADFRFYIVASNTGRAVGIRRLAVTVDGERVVSGSIPAGSSRSQRVEGSEIATFLPEEVDSLGSRFYAATGTAALPAAIEGDKGNAKITISPRAAKAIATAWRYGYLKQRLRSAMMLREKLDRQLQIARDQAANTAPEPETTDK